MTTEPAERGQRMGLARGLWLFGPPVLEAVAIFVASAQSRLPETPGGDKVAHFLAYGVLSALIFRAMFFSWRAPARAMVIGAAAIAAIYGASDELHQSLVPGRIASVADLIADVIGAVVGAGAALLVYDKLRSK